MSQEDRSDGAREAETLVYRKSTGEAESLAVPLEPSDTDSLRVKVLYYREGMKPGEEKVYPPHHMIVIDVASGKIVESQPCTPRDFGVDQQPGVPTDGFGLDHVSGEEFWESTERFYDIAPEVWALYAAGSTQLEPEARDLVREYLACYQRIAKAPLIPYYEAIGGDFFKWMERALA